jgi:hypothetical protein
VPPLVLLVAVPEVLQATAKQNLGRGTEDIRQVKKLKDVQFPLTNFQIGHAALLQLEGSGEIVLRESRALTLLSKPSSHAATLNVTWHAAILKGCVGVLKNSIRETVDGADRVMSDHAKILALALVEAGVHLRPDVARTSVLDWIAELAAGSSQYQTARASFEEHSHSAASVNTAGHQMAFEFGRCGYELGLHVGLRLRSVASCDEGAGVSASSRPEGAADTTSANDEGQESDSRSDAR